MTFQDTQIDQVVVTENGHILYREATQIMRDGVLVGQKFHRTSLIPGQDLTGQPEQIVEVARNAWTPEVISAYEAAVSARKGPL